VVLTKQLKYKFTDKGNKKNNAIIFGIVQWNPTMLVLHREIIFKSIEINCSMNVKNIQHEYSY